MSATANFNRLQKQSIVALLKDVDGNTDLATAIAVTTSPASPTAFSVVPGADNRHWDVVGLAVGSGAIFLAALGKQDSVSVTVTQSPDMSSLVVSLDGAPQPK